MTSKFLDRVANHILSRHARDLPDLRGATVLLPNYHVAQPLAQAMVRAASLPALLLPQMVTLDDWARSIPLAAPIQPDTQRITALYQALRERRWFADADLWSLSRELLAADGRTDAPPCRIAVIRRGIFRAARQSLPGAQRPGDAVRGARGARAVVRDG